MCTILVASAKINSLNSLAIAVMCNSFCFNVNFDVDMMDNFNLELSIVIMRHFRFLFLIGNRGDVLVNLNEPKIDEVEMKMGNA